MNNFNCSTEPCNIEVSVFADSFISQQDWKDNFEVVTESGYRTSGVYFYTDWGQIEALTESDLKAVDLSNTLVRDLKAWALEDDDTLYYYEKSELRALIKDELVALFETAMDYMSLKEAGDFAGEHNIGLVVDNYELIITRGYSQGDYAEVYVSDDLVNGGISQAIDNYFWDAPISYQITVDDDEEVGYAVDEAMDSLYEYNKDDVMEVLEKYFAEHEHKVYILETIKNMLPDAPEYS